MYSKIIMAFIMILSLIILSPMVYLAFSNGYIPAEMIDFGRYAMTLLVTSFGVYGLKSGYENGKKADNTHIERLNGIKGGGE